MSDICDQILHKDQFDNFQHTIYVSDVHEISLLLLWTEASRYQVRLHSSGENPCIANVEKAIQAKATTEICTYTE